MAKWMDLSQLIYEGMSYIPSFPEPCIRTHTSVEETGINVMQITIMTHMGTHIDAPLHFIRGGETIDGFPVDRFTGRGVVLDMTREELAEKFHDCARGLLSEATEQRVVETVYGLDGVDRVTELTVLLKG